MFWQGPHLVKYASKEIYKIRKNGDISIFAFPLATVITFCHTVARNFLYLWPSTCQVSLCLYKNIVNEIKPSHLRNCLVLVDIKFFFSFIFLHKHYYIYTNKILLQVHKIHFLLYINNGWHKDCLGTITTIK